MTGCNDPIHIRLFEGARIISIRPGSGGRPGLLFGRLGAEFVVQDGAVFACGTI
jgi:hypothetical protein